MKPGTRSLVSVFALLVTAAGCDHRPEDFAGAQASTQSFRDTWGQKLGEAQTRLAALMARAHALPPDLVGMPEINSELDGVGSQLTALGTQLGAVADEASARLGQRKRRLAEDGLARADGELRAAVESADGQLNALDGRITVAEKAHAEAIAAAASKPSDLPPPPPVGDLRDPAFPRAVGAATVTGIVFKPGTARLDAAAPSTKPALDQLVGFAGACNELTFALVGHTAGDGDATVNQRLSESQAHAVRKYLLAAGVTESKIARVEGAGSTRPLVAEPAPGSPEEAEMATEALAALRAQNRRISVTVITPCTGGV